jgi:hypothetical protein
MLLDKAVDLADRLLPAFETVRPFSYRVPDLELLSQGARAELSVISTSITGAHDFHVAARSPLACR